jgi:hypothetical protein
MPNWCSNTLKVSVTNTSKESYQQLRKFIDDVSEKGKKIKMEKAENYRKKFLKENFDSLYRDAAEVFVAHSEMDIKDFMCSIIHFNYVEKENVFKSQSAPFLMNNLLPVPMELLHPEAESHGGSNAAEKDMLRKKLLAKFGYESWYDWRCANWGTKWDLSEDTMVEDEVGDVIFYFFDTAWAPPVEFLKNICENYPLLNFHLTYEEPGCAFEGELDIQAGEIVNDETRDWTQKDCYSCGEKLNEGEKFDGEGYCPGCSNEDNEEDEGE